MERIEDPKEIEFARKRDGFCLWGMIKKDGCYGGVDVHHIDTRGSGGDDAKENLICLCRKHHNLAHYGKVSKTDLRNTLKRFWGYQYTPEELSE